MWDWERASVPYRPIYRRRLLRRRVLALLATLAIAIPYFLYHHYIASQPIGERVFNQVVSTIALRYFDRSYHGLAWQATAERYRSRVVNARGTAARYAALRAMLAQLHDSHTAVYSPDDLQPRRDEGHRGVFGMSPYAATNGPAVDWKTIAPGVGYLRIASFPDSIDSELAWALADIGRNRGLILDLRGNPGGLVDSVDSVAAVFLPKGTLISTGTRRYHFFGPQQFRATDTSRATYSGRLVVLVDRNSRSGAESLARALQYYHRATLVGTHTAGKVLGVDAEIALADGGLLRVATLDMHAPDGQRLEGRGVSPDVAIANPQQQLSTAQRLVADDSAPLSASPEPSPKNLGVVKACPLTISDFSVSAIGTTNRTVEYRIDVSPPSGPPVNASLVVSGDAQDAPHTVTVSGLDATSDAVVFHWSNRTLKRVGILAVDANGGRRDCNPAETTALTNRLAFISRQSTSRDPGEFPMPASMLAELGPMNDVARSFIPTFDDSSDIGIVNGIGLPLHDARMLGFFPPEYPEIAKVGGEQGDVLVAVTIGAGGRVLSTEVVSSSAGPTLNRSARSTAERTPFTEPLVNGGPAKRTYLIVYSFRLSGFLTGLEFAGDLFR